MPGLDVGRDARSSHLHQYESCDSHEHESSETEQEGAIDRQHSRGQHHEERQDRQSDVVALAPKRKHSDNYAEQRQVNRGGKKTAGNGEIVDGEENEVSDR
jgi:hypothetical protein